MDFLIQFLTMYVRLYVLSKYQLLSLFFVGVEFVNLFAAYILYVLLYQYSFK